MKIQLGIGDNKIIEGAKLQKVESDIESQLKRDIERYKKDLNELKNVKNLNLLINLEGKRKIINAKKKQSRDLRAK